MRNYFNIVLIAVVSASLTACGGIGHKGSIAWNATASDEEKRNYYTGVCLREGYKLDTREMKACVRSEPRVRIEYRGSGYAAPASGYKQPSYKQPDIYERKRSFDCINSGGVANRAGCVR